MESKGPRVFFVARLVTFINVDLGDANWLTFRRSQPWEPRDIPTKHPR